jgi:hypothetical protein
VEQQQEEGESTIMCNNITITLAIARTTFITLQGRFVSFVCVRFCHHHISCSNNNVTKGGGGHASVATIIGRKGGGHSNTTITTGGDFFFLHDSIIMLVIMFFLFTLPPSLCNIMGLIGFFSFAS